MSRPFSYNDENFNIIGNILFIHINISSKAYNKGDKLIAVTTADTTALDKGETADTTADTTAFTIPREVMSRVMKTDYGKFVVTNSIPCLRVVLADGTISSAKITSDGVVTLNAPATGKLIIDGTLDIECNC